MRVHFLRWMKVAITGLQLSMIRTNAEYFSYLLIDDMPVSCISQEKKIWQIFMEQKSLINIPYGVSKINA